MSKVVTRAKAVFAEAFAAGQRGDPPEQAWRESQARGRLAQPAPDPMMAIERRDKVLYFFDEGWRAGTGGGQPECAWRESYSLHVAKDWAERIALRVA